MAKGTKTVGKQGADGNVLVANNRKARYNYELIETLECGAALTGSEVKSLREGTAQVSEAYATIEAGELWLRNAHIPAWSHAQAHSGHDPLRVRKLLAHRQQIARLGHEMALKRLTLVVTKVYFRNGNAKVELALARGKKTHDKRHDIAARDVERETRRALRHNGRPH